MVARGIALLAAAVLVAVLVPASASAAPRTSVADPDDTSSSLDLKRVQLEAKGSRIVARFTTYDAFAFQDLDGSNGLHLRFGLKKKRYREVLVQSLGGEWVGTICSGRVGRLTIDGDCDRLKAKRTGDRGMRVVIPRKLIDPGARTYRWNAWSAAQLYSAGCAVGEGTHCEDHVAPEGSYLRWRAPKA